MNYCNAPFARSEALDIDCVIATYYAIMPDFATAMRRAGAFAVGQTIGTWLPVPGITDEMVNAYQGRVLSVIDANPWEEQDKHFILRIAFPLANFGGSLTQLMTALVGNDVSTSLRIKLIDLELSVSEGLPFLGPTQGINELREIVGVTDRPLVLNMIKPCAGYSPEAGRRLFSQVARGGVDLVKDDELLGSPHYNSVGKRTELYVRESERIALDTGHQTLYVPNISGKPGEMRQRTEDVINAGARICLVNFVFGGLDTLSELNELYGKKIFLLAHYAGLSTMDSIASGIANGVFLGILARMAGAHGVMTMCPDSQNPRALYDFTKTVQMQKLPIPALAPTVTAVGGGITPVNQQWLQDSLGKDIIIGIGGAIQGHPMGITEGAKAAMLAVRSKAEGIALETAAENSPALKMALELWK